MKLIVGLGNPNGIKNSTENFDGTRHNVGFRFLDEFLKRLEPGAAFKSESKFKTEIATVTTNGEKVVLMKPETFYNLSGEAVQAVMNFYKIQPEDVMIVHDELSLPLGTVRMRQGGSDAGNNGIKSVNNHCGPNTQRIKIGVDSDKRKLIGDVNFVLGKFNSEENEQLNKVSSVVSQMIIDFINGKNDPTTHRASE